MLDFNPPIKITLNERIRPESRIDTDREWWRCGEHAAMCAFWLTSHYSQVYIVTLKFHDKRSSHTVCTVRHLNKDVGTFDFTHNKFHPEFIYGKHDRMTIERYAKAQSFITDCSPTIPAERFWLYDYKHEDIKEQIILSMRTLTSVD